MKQSTAHVRTGPAADRPYFKKREILPIPPENVYGESSRAVGLPDGILWHNHSPGLEVLPNGDVLASYFTSAGYVDQRRDSACVSGEATPDIALLALRLRFGSDEWEMPDLLLDYPDINDVAPLLWNDGGTVRLFWGGYLSGVPFQSAVSRDNGATWTDLRFIRLTGPWGNSASGSRSTQPSALPTAPSMSLATAPLASRFCGPAATTGSRGETQAEERAAATRRAFPSGMDLCSAWEGRAPTSRGTCLESLSRDSGKSWQVTRSPFPALGGNQRPTLIRLASGRLFFAADCQDIKGKRPADFPERTPFVALSDDDGKTWRRRPLPGVLPHETQATLPATLGYAVARQAPNGIIHLITSMNDPSLHFELNEAWILGTGDTAADAENPPAAVLLQGEEKYRDGRLRGQWSGRIGPDGRYLLHGASTWFYAGGRKQWEATYRDGVKVGVETYWSPDGRKRWTWERGPDGTAVWTQWWPNGQKKSESGWRMGRAVGVARRWDSTGKLSTERRFEAGHSLD